MVSEITYQIKSENGHITKLRASDEEDARKQAEMRTNARRNGETVILQKVTTEDIQKYRKQILVPQSQVVKEPVALE